MTSLMLIARSWYPEEAPKKTDGESEVHREKRYPEEAPKEDDGESEVHRDKRCAEKPPRRTLASLSLRFIARSGTQRRPPRIQMASTLDRSGVVL